MKISGDTVAVGAMGAAGLSGFVLPVGIADAGPWALLAAVVAFIFYGVFRGWIVPKPHYDTLMERALAAEAANERLSQNNSTLTEAAMKNTAIGETVEKFVVAIQEARQKSGDLS